MINCKNKFNLPIIFNMSIILFYENTVLEEQAGVFNNRLFKRGRYPIWRNFTKTNVATKRDGLDVQKNE